MQGSVHQLKAGLSNLHYHCRRPAPAPARQHDVNRATERWPTRATTKKIPPSHSPWASWQSADGAAAMEAAAASSSSSRSAWTGPRVGDVRECPPENFWELM